LHGLDRHRSCRRTCGERRRPHRPPPEDLAGWRQDRRLQLLELSKVPCSTGIFFLRAAMSSPEALEEAFGPDGFEGAPEGSTSSCEELVGAVLQAKTCRGLRVCSRIICANRAFVTAPLSIRRYASAERAAAWPALSSLSCRNSSAQQQAAEKVLESRAFLTGEHDVPRRRTSPRRRRSHVSAGWSGSDEREMSADAEVLPRGALRPLSRAAASRSRQAIAYTPNHTATSTDPAKEMPLSRHGIVRAPRQTRCSPGATPSRHKDETRMDIPSSPGRA